MAEDKIGKKNGDKKPRNVRKPFKRQPPLSDLDKQRIENARTSETIKKIEKGIDDYNKADKELKRDLDRADTAYKKKQKQIKTTEQTTNRAINRLNKAQWKVNRAQRASGARGSLVGAAAYALSDKYLAPQARKAGKKLGKALRPVGRAIDKAIGYKKKKKK